MSKSIRWCGATCSCLAAATSCQPLLLLARVAVTYSLAIDCKCVRVCASLAAHCRRSLSSSQLLYELEWRAVRCVLVALQRQCVWLDSRTADRLGVLLRSAELVDALLVALATVIDRAALPVVAQSLAAEITAAIHVRLHWPTAARSCVSYACVNARARTRALYARDTAARRARRHRANSALRGESIARTHGVRQHTACVHATHAVCTRADALPRLARHCCAASEQHRSRYCRQRTCTHVRCVARTRQPHAYVQLYRAGDKYTGFVPNNINDAVQPRSVRSRLRMSSVFLCSLLARAARCDGQLDRSVQ